MLDGFLGFRRRADGVELPPRLPRDRPELAVNRIRFLNLRFRIAVSRHQREIQTEGRAAEPLWLRSPEGPWRRTRRGLDGNPMSGHPGWWTRAGPCGGWPGHRVECRSGSGQRAGKIDSNDETSRRLQTGVWPVAARGLHDRRVDSGCRPSGRAATRSFRTAAGFGPTGPSG